MEIIAQKTQGVAGSICEDCIEEERGESPLKSKNCGIKTK